MDRTRIDGISLAARKFLENYRLAALWRSLLVIGVTGGLLGFVYANDFASRLVPQTMVTVLAVVAVFYASFEYVSSQLASDEVREYVITETERSYMEANAEIAKSGLKVRLGKAPESSFSGLYYHVGSASRQSAARKFLSGKFAQEEDPPEYVDMEDAIRDAMSLSYPYLSEEEIERKLREATLRQKERGAGGRR